MFSTNSLSGSAYSSVSSILDDCSALLNEAPSMTEMTTIILCACIPTLPKSFQLFKGNYKRASTYQQSHSTDTDFKKSRGGGVISRNLTSTGSSWPESDDHEMQAVGDYHPLEEEQVTKPRPLSKIDSFIDPPCWGDQGASRNGSEGFQNNAIWKTVHIENSSDPKKASRPNSGSSWQISPQGFV